MGSLILYIHSNKGCDILINVVPQIILQKREYRKKPIILDGGFTPSMPSKDTDIVPA